MIEKLQLARLAGCSFVGPDGAAFLAQVRDAFDADLRDDVRARRAERPDVSDWVEEVRALADDMVPIATMMTWRTFADLGAWEFSDEAIADGLIDLRDGLERAARVALYLIAEQLIFALVEADQDDAGI